MATAPEAHELALPTVGPVDAEVESHVAGPGAPEHRQRERRRHAPHAARHESGVLLLPEGHAAERRADPDPGARAERGRVEARIGHRQACGRHRHRAETVETARAARVEMVGRVEVVDLGGDVRREHARVEAIDLAHGGPICHDSVPQAVRAGADRGDGADPGDDGASAAHEVDASASSLTRRSVRPAMASMNCGPITWRAAKSPISGQSSSSRCSMLTSIPSPAGAKAPRHLHALRHPAGMHELDPPLVGQRPLDRLPAHWDRATPRAHREVALVAPGQAAHIAVVGQAAAASARHRRPARRCARSVRACAGGSRSSRPQHLEHGPGREGARSPDGSLPGRSQAQRGARARREARDGVLQQGRGGQESLHQPGERLLGGEGGAPLAPVGRDHVAGPPDARRLPRVRSAARGRSPRR